MRRGKTRIERGFTYLWLLVAVAVIGIGLTAASEVWLTSSRRERVVQADWAATQIVTAIGGYYEGSPVGVREYPRSLEDLLQDERFPTIRRHLRALYPNPLRPDAQWELLTGADRRVRGVRIAVPWDSGPGSRDYVYVSAAGG